MAIPKKLRQRNNENSAKYFAAGITALITVFIISHWLRLLYKRYGLKKNRSPGALVAIVRFSRYFLTREIPGFPSLGHGLVFLGYIIINVCITFFKIDWVSLVSISKRLGWVTLSNLTLVIFLSLKNTPIAFLTAYSYERLQPLHQIAGYTTVACCLMHAVVYVVCWDRLDNLHELLEKSQIMGIVGGIAFLLIILTLVLRKSHYELFHIIHSVLAILIIIVVGLHRPKLATKSSYAVIFCGAIWGFDRLLRTLKLCFDSIWNKATLTPLPHGGTRISLRKSLKGAKAGMHVWLHIPAVSVVQLHPFTIVSTSTNPLELVVAAQDGFTRDLHTLANDIAGLEIQASVDGPYGSVPDFRGLDRVVFIAGGSGGSYTFGIAVDLLRQLGNENSRVAIDFVWVVRHTDMLTWYDQQLAELSSSPRVKLHIHVTHHSLSTSSTPSINSTSSSTSASIQEIPLASLQPSQGLQKIRVPSTYPTVNLTSSRRQPSQDIEKTSELPTSINEVPPTSLQLSQDPENIPLPPSTISITETPQSTTRSSQDWEKTLPPPASESNSNSNSPSSPQSSDLEKTLQSMQSSYTIRSGRPNVSAFITGIAVNEASKWERLGVVACGPKDMMGDIRRSVSKNVKVDGPAVEFWGESFGW